MLTGKEKVLFDAIFAESMRNDIEVITVEIIGGSKSPVIRVYLDREGGIGLDDIASAQSWIDPIVEGIDPFPGAYTLEISSPGINRPLRSEEHFANQIGCEASLRTSSPIDGRSNYKGKLTSAENGIIGIDCGGEEFHIPLESIRKANLIGKIDFK